MDCHCVSLSLNTTTALNPTIVGPLFHSIKPSGRRRGTRRRGIGIGSISFPRKPQFAVFSSSKDEPRLDQWDQMELKFGRLLGEDPNLTIAKVMGRKLNPELTPMEIEKAFHKKKGKALYDDVEEVPFDASRNGQSLSSTNGLNLVRPVPKKGVKFEVNNKPLVSEVKKPRRPLGAAPVDNAKGKIPNVILRRPTTYKEDDDESEKASKLRIKPNLLLNMGKGQTKERFSDITLLKKPEPIGLGSTPDEEQEPSLVNKSTNDMVLINKPERMSRDSSLGPEQECLGSTPDEEQEPSLVNESTNDMVLINKPERMSRDSSLGPEQECLRSTPDEEQEPSLVNESTNDMVLINKPERINHDSSLGPEEEFSGDDLKENSLEAANFSAQTVITTKSNFDESLETKVSMTDGDSATGLQPLGQSDVRSGGGSTVNGPSEIIEDSHSVQASLLGKPKRLDQYVKGTSEVRREEAVLGNLEAYGNTGDLESFVATSPIKESEDTDWTRVEGLVKTGGRAEVELISCSTRGFVVSFGSLVGFLPYRNLAARWKFLAFESWLRRKGLDPSLYKQSLGIIGGFDATNKTTSPETDEKVDLEISPETQLSDLLRIYDQEKLKFLTSFIGQKIKVNVILADRKSRKLIFSVKPKEKEELVEKKRDLMARLSVGDVIKCYIKKITYFGIFVEVEGVPALIHQTEVSWDATLDPASYFKVGQIVDAKVHQLDFSSERIFLSLRKITADPLSEALEAVTGDHESLDGRLEPAEADTEFAEAESLIKELQQFEGIQSVSKGRFFLSPGLAPTFQVYMASMFEDQYKILARSENKVQEVIVRTSLGKEEMKSAILTCANRVE